MKHVPHERWPWALAAYALAGAVPAVLIAAYDGLARGRGWPPPLGVLVGVNLVLPACIVACAIWYPKPGVAFPGALLAGIAFTLVRVTMHDWHFWLWTPMYLLGILHPIVVAAVVVAGIIATVAAMMAGSVRRIGALDEHLRCKACGYLLAELGVGVHGEVKCPECGQDGHVLP